LYPVEEVNVPEQVLQVYLSFLLSSVNVLRTSAIMGSFKAAFLIDLVMLFLLTILSINGGGGVSRGAIYPYYDF
jgi:hypothetical protein